MPIVDGQQYTPAQWWRALVVTAYMTGLRIKELLAVRREDLDFQSLALFGDGTQANAYRTDSSQRL
jgi:integrase